ncbi:MAG: hypothetical protein ABSE64_14400 [Vulcanimicrobiaceae bacterium]|jgi:hypothetical protein
MFIDNTIMVGANFFNNNVGIGFPDGSAITEIISPGDNVNGVLIRTLTITAQWDFDTSEYEGSATYVYADTSVPSTPYDTSKRVIYFVVSPYNNLAPQAYQWTGTMPYPVALPSGYGLWLACQGGPTTDTSITTAAITWDYVTI